MKKTTLYLVVRQTSDVLLKEFRDESAADSIDIIDIKEGVVLHLDDDGSPLEIEILDASG